MFNAIYNFFGSIIRFFFDLTGDYTIALFVFTLIMQVILLPLGIKQQKNQVKQASLAPKIAAIRDKYKGRTDQATQQKMQQETMDLYQRENFNPAGGCLPLLIQLPIIMFLYNVVSKPLSFILKYSTETIDAIKGVLEIGADTAVTELDLASKMSALGPEAFSSLNLDIFPDFKLFGMDLTQAPVVDGKVSNMLLLIVPIVTFIAMYGSQFITRKFSYQSPEVKEQQKSMSMRIMNIAMPLMSVYFAAVWPATLGVYWILRNILQTIQSVVLSKAIPVPKFTEEDFAAARRELAGKSKKKSGEKKTNADPNRPKVRSLHYIDADDDDEAPAEASKKNEVKNVPDEEAEDLPETEEKSEEKSEETAKPADKGVAPAPMKDDSRKTKK